MSTDRFTEKEKMDIFGGGKSIVHPQYRIGRTDGQMISPLSGGEGSAF